MLILIDTDIAELKRLHVERTVRLLLQPSVSIASPSLCLRRGSQWTSWAHICEGFVAQQLIKLVLSMSAFVVFGVCLKM